MHHLSPSFGEIHGKTETTHMSLNRRLCHKLKTALNKQEGHQFLIWLFVYFVLLLILFSQFSENKTTNAWT